MISTRPLSGSYALAYKHDPAFDVERDGYDAEYDRCLITLDFTPITLPGQQPTRFYFRPLTMHEFRKIIAGAHSTMVAWVAFRLCLERVENGGADLDKLERLVDGERPNLGELVGMKQTDLIDSASNALSRPAGEIVANLGDQVIKRCTQLSPPS
jgi:hypothetical protein